MHKFTVTLLYLLLNFRIRQFGIYALLTSRTVFDGLGNLYRTHTYYIVEAVVSVETEKRLRLVCEIVFAFL